MCDRKKDLQDATIADVPGIEDNLNRFRVSGHAGANHLVMRRVRGAASVTGDGAKDALDMLVNTLDAPEAPASEGRDLRFRKGIRWFVEHRRRDRTRVLGRRRQTWQRDPRAQHQRRKNQRRPIKG